MRMCFFFFEFVAAHFVNFFSTSDNCTLQCVCTRPTHLKEFMHFVVQSAQRIAMLSSNAFYGKRVHELTSKHPWMRALKKKSDNKDPR